MYIKPSDFFTAEYTVISINCVCITDKLTPLSASHCLLNADAQKALRRLVDVIGTNGQSPLFVSRKHDANGNLKAISRQQAHELLKALFAKIGEFGNVSTHTLRKTFAARIYEQTGKLEIVQIALGHKSINSTISYLAFGNDDLNRAIMGVM